MKTQYWYVAAADGEITGWGKLQAQDAPSLPEGAQSLSSTDFDRLQSMDPITRVPFMVQSGLEFRAQAVTPELEAHRIAQNMPALLSSLHEGLAGQAETPSGFEPFMDAMATILQSEA